MKIIQFEVFGAAVTGYLHEDHERLSAHRVRPALVVCPGGGYDHLSPREADPPALQFFVQGYQVFLLSYSVGEKAKNFLPLRQLGAAVSQIRRAGVLWHIDPSKIAVMGFSAGGHLAAMLGASAAEDSRPNALVLCYPVITMGGFTHRSTKETVSAGQNPDAFSVENHISGDFPPTFVWHTAEDPSVPVENTLLLIAALRKRGVPFACHIFEKGEHGLSTCTAETETLQPDCAQWLPLAKSWLNTRFTFTP